MTNKKYINYLLEETKNHIMNKTGILSDNNNIGLKRILDSNQYMSVFTCRFDSSNDVDEMFKLITDPMNPFLNELIEKCDILLLDIEDSTNHKVFKYTKGMYECEEILKCSMITNSVIFRAIIKL